MYKDDDIQQHYWELSRAYRYAVNHSKKQKAEGAGAAPNETVNNNLLSQSMIQMKDMKKTN